MRATEHQFQTPEQVRDYLQEALAIVKELDPPDDLRVACFDKAADLVSHKQVFFDRPAVIPDLTRH